MRDIHCSAKQRMGDFQVAFQLDLGGENQAGPERWKISMSPV
jgi:hypothetical protein